MTTYDATCEHLFHGRNHFVSVFPESAQVLCGHGMVPHVGIHRWRIDKWLAHTPCPCNARLSQSFRKEIHM